MQEHTPLPCFGPSANSFLDEGSVLFLVELTELREQLAQAERISVLGQLASALAHELSQPLAATASNVEAAQMELEGEKPDLEELRAILNDIGRNDHRASEIINRMRQFSQRRAITMQPLRVEDVVHNNVAGETLNDTQPVS